MTSNFFGLIFLLVKQLLPGAENPEIEVNRNFAGLSLLISRRLLKTHDKIEDKLSVKSICPHYWGEMRNISVLPVNFSSLIRDSFKKFSDTM